MVSLPSEVKLSSRQVRRVEGTGAGEEGRLSKRIYGIIIDLALRDNEKMT